MSIEIIKKLRDETSVSLAKCKEALEENNYDIEKAREVLRQKGSVAAAKKAERDLGAGVVASYIHNTNKVGAMIELLTETDFVSKNEEFIKVANDIAMHCAALSPQFIRVEDIDEETIAKLKEELSDNLKDKPEDMREKILESQLSSRYKEFVLLEQEYLKDDSLTIKNLIEGLTQKFGERVDMGRMAIWRI